MLKLVQLLPLIIQPSSSIPEDQKTDSSLTRTLHSVTMGVLLRE